MSITYVIPGAHTLDQLASPTLDGHPDEDARENCVAATLAEGLTILTGKRFEPDQLHDAVYGQGYIGPQAAWKYVSYCAQQGVDLAPHNSSQAGLVALIRTEVAAGHPVVITMPSQWGTAPANPLHPSGSTHVGLAVGLGPNEIRVMNPWHGFMQDASDEWWQARLCEGQVWLMSRAASAPKAEQSSAKGTSPVWKNVDANTVEDSRGVKAHFGMANYLRAHSALGDVVKGFPGETYYNADNSFLPLEGDTVLWWSKSRGSVVEGGGEVAVALFDALHAQSAQFNASVQALKTQLSAAEAKVVSQQELPAATTAALRADIGGLKAAADALDQLTNLGAH